MTSLSKKNGEKIQVGNQTFVLVDSFNEDTKDSPQVQEIKSTRKANVVFFHTPNFVDPSGKPFDISNDKIKRSFILAGEAGPKQLVSRKGRGKGKQKAKFMTKPPPSKSSTFGNEGVPRIARHLNPLRNYLYNQFLPAFGINSATIGAVNNWSFTVGQLDGIASYTGLYDEYCVRKIEMWFMPKVTENSIINNVMPLLATAYDPDGSAVTGITDVEQYESAVVTNATVGHYLCYTPSIAVATFGGAFTKYSYEMNQWCDIANTDISQYGACSALTGVNSAGDFSYNVEVRMWVEFRGVR